MFRRLRSLARILWSRDQFEEGMSDELRFHIEQYTRELIGKGVAPQEAARRARLEFGGVNSVQEECREARGLQAIDTVSRQFRHAFRALGKTPKFTATALLTLAICLGANLAIFGVVDCILLRPLPFPEAERLVTIFNSYPKAGVDRDGSSFTNYYERRGRIPALSGLAMYRYETAVVGESGATERREIARVTPEFFEVLGARLKGRSFTEEETTPELNSVVILTEAWWREHGKPELGTQIRLNGVARSIIGVLSPDFHFLSSRARLFLPLSSTPEQRSPRQRHNGGNARHLIARLKPGASLNQAQAQIDAQNAALGAGTAEEKMEIEAGFRSVVAPLHADHVATVRPVLLWMQAGALVLLLIGGVNLTNLLLIRANSRVKELSIRHALGASRMHITGEIAVETTMLTVAGGLLGLAAGAAGIHLIKFLGADRLPLGSAIALDVRIAGVCVAGAVCLGILFSIPIAWFSLRARRTRGAHSDSRGGTSSPAAQRLRHAFIVLQMALSVVLLSGAGLLARSLEQAMATSPGFRADHILTGEISPAWAKYGSWQTRLALNEALLRKLSGQPGVAAAGLVNNVPLSGNDGKSAATVKGRVAQAGESTRGHYAYGVDGEYFTAMGFTLLQGRFLTGVDSRRNDRVCAVDEDFARYYWPGADAVGQQLFRGSRQEADSEAFTVVGVVAAVKQAGMTELAAQGAVYYPYAHRGDDRLFVAIRTSVAPEALALALQKTVREVDPDLPVSNIRAMETLISDSLVTPRAAAMMAGIFSGIALALSAIGAYGVVSYSVTQRRREIGLRMALGALPAQIRTQFVNLAFRLLIGGILIGTVGAFLMGRAIKQLLFGVSPAHVPTMVGAALLLVLVSLLACVVPAWRASQINPLQVLAEE
ncbi:MAG: permease [Bryobacterales bacterium]|nr:permease [Bryobacterales bacterium]